MSTSSEAAAAGLTISAVAARTGLSVPVLRAWERRHGFPRPARLEGGHRRYDEAEVARILRVVDERDAGRSLEAAIELVRRGPGSRPQPVIDPDHDGTIHAGLRRRHPDLPARTLSRRAMLALSHAIEDEALAQADRATITGAFQRVDAYRRALPRWRELARSAASTLVFADFRRSGVARGVHQVAIPGRAPLTREWAVVCDAPRSAAVLAGWERADGRFEVVWTVEPEIVREATELGRHLASTYAPRLALPDAPHAAADPATTARRATAVTNRAIAYLDG